MPINKESYQQIKKELDSKDVTIVAVSKSKPNSDILELYELGQRDFGENYVQELVEKAEKLPKDIRWHFIGHLQSNKVKHIAGFVQLIQSVDSLRLLQELNKHGEKNKRVIDCLLQIHIAEEETKFGFDAAELDQLFNELEQTKMQHVMILGLMGMASFTDDLEKVRNEFRLLKRIFDKQTPLRSPVFGLRTLSMGMSSDYKIALEEGTTMVRIGSLLFGERNT